MSGTEEPKRLSSSLEEAANRAEATALLIRAGYKVYRPEADVGGEDLILRCLSDGELLLVQMKSRPTVDHQRYGRRGIWMLFPDPEAAPHKRDWFLVPHDVLYQWVKDRHGHTPKWRDSWSYPHISEALKSFLYKFKQDKWPISLLDSGSD